MSTLASDNFDRVNSTGLGTNWTVTTEKSAMNVSGNVAVATDVTTTDQMENYTGVSWPDDQWTRAKLSITENGTPAGGDQGVALIVRSSTSQFTCYRVAVDHASSSNVGLHKMTNATYGHLAAATEAWTNGDTWELRVTGSNPASLTVLHNGTEVLTYDDSTSPIASGNAGIAFSTSEPSGTTASIDDWEGGDTALAPLTVDLASSPGSLATDASGATFIALSVARPASDVSIGNWKDQDGGTTNLYQAIDEATASDADYITSESLAVSGSSPCDIGLTSLAGAGDGTRTLRYRYAKSVAGGAIDLQVDLMQSTSVVETWTHTNISNTPADAEQTVTGTVTDYTTLRLRFTASRTS